MNFHIQKNRFHRYLEIVNLEAFEKNSSETFNNISSNRREKLRSLSNVECKKTNKKNVA